MDFDPKAIDDIIARHGTGLSSAIPILQAIQREFRYISEEAMRRVAERTEIPASQLYGVATFYTQFRLKPVGRHIIKVCHGTACHVAGAQSISDILAEELRVPAEGGTTEDDFFTVEKVACLGCCSLAPVMMIDEEVYGKLTRPKIGRILKSYRDRADGKVAAGKDPLEGLGPVCADAGKKAITEVLVGMGSCGIASGARAVCDLFRLAGEKLGYGFAVTETGCIGMCHREPLVELVAGDGTRTLYGGVDVALAKKIIAEHVAHGRPVSAKVIEPEAPGSEEHAFFAKQRRVVLKNCGRIDPESIEAYEGTGGYKALMTVLSGMSPERVIDEIAESGLRGRGGAGFPTGRKWLFARKAVGDEKYVVCNADEGDPGAFMDRSIIESDPHRVLEGMAIAAYAIGATKGFVYCRAEYPLAVARLTLAIEQARRKGYLGKGICGSSFSFDLKVKEGAGAFVCGEETALIASIEGRRGMPRVRPPFPAESGLWGKPTNINNVETYANVPWIIRNGAAAFAAMGTEKSKGTKVFALAGDVKRGGLVEVPMGMALSQVIEEIGGGTSSGRPVKAVQMGGPSGGCIPSRLMDTVVDYDAVGATGAIMGSGGMVVMDSKSCMVDIARFFLNFTQDESCGKCTFCRIGTRRMLEILTRITEGEGEEGDVELLEELSIRIKDASLCGLGQTAPNPVLTTIRYFRDEYDAHIREHKCPAGKCRALITYRISEEKCIGCGACVPVCPTKCIRGEKKSPHVIDEARCTRCGACEQICPVDAVEVE